MKKPFRAAAYLLVLATGILFSHCAEKNKDFPVNNWDYFAYPSGDFAQNPVTGILFENEHSLWLGSDSCQGILYYDGYQWNTFKNILPGIAPNRVQGITRSADGLLWVGAQDGLASWDGQHWEQQSAGTSVKKIIPEGAHNLWVLTANSPQSVLHYKQGFFETLDLTDIPDAFIRSISCPDDQSLWFATEGLGLCVQVKGKLNTHVGSALGFSDRAYDVTSDAEGNTWAADDQGHLIYITPSDTLLLNSGASDTITKLVPIEGEGIFCVANHELLQYHLGKWRVYGPANGNLPDLAISALSLYTKGYLLIAYQNGKMIALKLQI